MFDSLKKKLKESIEKLSKKTEVGTAESSDFEPERKAETQGYVKTSPKPPEATQVAPVPKAESKAIPKVTKKPETRKAKERPPKEKTWVERPADMEMPKPEPTKSIPIREAPELEQEQEKEGISGHLQSRGEKRGFLGRFREKVTTRAISSQDIDEFFSENETDMFEANMAMEVVDFLKQRLKENLAQKQAKRFGAKDVVQEAFEDSLYDVVNQGTVNIEDVIKKARSEGRPACMIFLGFNGSGKTTSIAKLAHYLKGEGHTPVIAAADTFRAASIEQLEVHGQRLGVKVIKHQYGADSAAVVFDAVKFAKTKGYDIVLADTAGRSHADKNLMDELTKVVRVNKPDLKVLVVDSLTGNDAVEQAKTFDKAAGVDTIVLTKVDVNKKGGAILSVCYAIKKPILFLGVGQDYDNIEMFEPRKFARELLE